MLPLVLFLLGAEPAQVITKPGWVEMPTQDEMDAYYPELARFSGIEGRAVVECAVAVSGAAQNCSVVSEEPTGFDFGTATVDASVVFRMRPKTVDGVPVGGAKVRVPLNWTLAQGARKLTLKDVQTEAEVCAGYAEAGFKSWRELDRFFLYNYWLEAYTDTALRVDLKPSEIAARLEASRRKASATLAGGGAVPEPCGKTGWGALDGGPDLQANVPLVAASPAAQVADAVIEQPATPTSLLYFYPRPAMEAGLELTGAFECARTRDGRLENCALVSEQPAGHGYGPAALEVIKDMRVGPNAADGTPLAGRKARVPLTFRVPEYLTAALPADAAEIYQEGERCAGYYLAAAESAPYTDRTREDVLNWTGVLAIGNLVLGRTPAEFNESLVRARKQGAADFAAGAVDASYRETCGWIVEPPSA
ncbi:TonB family protein [Caulobacter sp. 17J65-9]|uniref:TonB family protein n=1 Tax=Caulobacter sp. 17J65-9 TaxID=2709382 RepID=UPI0013CB43CB|nr:TonB family protein [Caulobacter sp. 17J65-9]NEX94029.1 TonB family protein [Caulobacter sp. 17J65-9]